MGESRPSRRYGVGVDGCRAGWVAVALNDPGVRAELFPDIAALCVAHDMAELILVDIPIGLPAASLRACDIQARRLLAPRRSSSVFSVPCRPSVYASDYRAACEINRALIGKAFSKQAWNLCPKIREVDRYLRERALAGPPLRESHPELCFRALAGGRPMRHSKRTEAGQAERLALVQPWVPEAASLVADIPGRHGRGRLARDDVLDALVLAVVASMPDDGLGTVPGSIEHDAEGLAQEMVVPNVAGPVDPGGPGFARALADRYAVFVAAYEAGDAAALAPLYTDDAALLEPDKAPIRGRETILRDLEAWFEGFSFSNGRFETWELEVLGDTAWDLSYFEMEAVRRSSGERFGERWKQLCIWRRGQDGVWRLHRLMYNRHRPPRTS